MADDRGHALRFLGVPSAELSSAAVFAAFAGVPSPHNHAPPGSGDYLTPPRICRICPPSRISSPPNLTVTTYQSRGRTASHRWLPRRRLLEVISLGQIQRRPVERFCDRQARCSRTTRCRSKVPPNAAQKGVGARLGDLESCRSDLKPRAPTRARGRGSTSFAVDAAPPVGRGPSSSFRG